MTDTQTHPFDLIARVAEVREHLKNANTIQRMAIADKVADTALESIIILAGRLRLVEAEFMNNKGDVQMVDNADKKLLEALNVRVGYLESDMANRLKAAESQKPGAKNAKSR